MNPKEVAMATTNGAGSPPAGGTPGRRARVYAARDFLAGDPVRQEAMSAVLAQNWWLMALRGVFAVLFGLIALFAPGAALLSLALLFSAYMLVDGALGIAAGVRAAQRNERWGWLIAEGLANIVVGVIAFVWPGRRFSPSCCSSLSGRFSPVASCSRRPSASRPITAAGGWRLGASRP
jgi:hypothetical protein